MSKTLVISDNEILNQLYVTNLEVYLSTEVKVVLSTESAQELIEKGSHFDLIITMSMINGHDSAVMIYELLQKSQAKAKLLVIGSPSKEIPDIVLVPSSYHLQNLIRSCALILGVTAKAMASLELPEFFAIDTTFLARLREAPCSVYLQVKKSGEEISYAMIAKKGSNLSVAVKKFADEGIEKLYINSLDRLLVINKVSTTVVDFIKSTDHLGIEEKSVAVQAGFEFVASEFCQTEAAALEVMNIANACTKAMEEMSKEAPSLRGLLQILNSNKNGFIYSHSMLAAFIASHIIKKVSWGGEGHIEKINFVLFFHDIMLAPIYAKHPTLKYEEDLLFSEALTDKEKEIVLNHARLSAELVITYRRAPLGADLLIKQHHGMTNGVGFAMEYKDDISPLSKIVLISEAFVEEFVKGKEADSHYQVDLKKMIGLLSERFKKNTYKKIIDTLETLSL